MVFLEWVYSLFGLDHPTKSACSKALQRALTIFNAKQPHKFMYSNDYSTDCGTWMSMVLARESRWWWELCLSMCGMIRGELGSVHISERRSVTYWCCTIIGWDMEHQHFVCNHHWCFFFHHYLIWICVWMGIIIYTNLVKIRWFNGFGLISK